MGQPQQIDIFKYLKWISKQYARTNIKKHNFYQRVIDDWKSLPQANYDLLWNSIRHTFACYTNGVK